MDMSPKRRDPCRIHLVQTVDDRFGSLAWRERAEEPVVQRQDIAVIGVRLRALARVMDLVDIGRHPDQRQHAVERTPEPDVAVLQNAVRGRYEPLNDDRQRRNSDQPHRNEYEEKAPGRFHGVRAIGGRDIHEIVAVMNLLKSPQHRKEVQRSSEIREQSLSSSLSSDIVEGRRTCSPDKFLTYVSASAARRSLT